MEVKDYPLASRADGDSFLGVNAAGQVKRFGADSGREKLLATRHYYVSNDDGDDENDGSQAHPWKTLQHARDICAYTLDFNNQRVWIHIADSATEYAGIFFSSNRTGTGAEIYIGNNQNPNAVKIGSAYGEGYGVTGCFFFTPGVVDWIWLSGVRLQSTAAPVLDADVGGGVQLGEPTWQEPTKIVIAGMQNNGAAAIVGNVYDSSMDVNIIDSDALAALAPHAFIGCGLPRHTPWIYWPLWKVQGTADLTFVDAFIMCNGGHMNTWGAVQNASKIHGRKFMLGGDAFLQIQSMDHAAGDQPGTMTGDSRLLVGDVPTGKTIGSIGPRNQSSISFETPISGFNINFPEYTAVLILDPAAALALGTVVMPATPLDGQTIYLKSTKTITALTLAPAAGQTVKGAPSTIGPGDTITAIYRTSNATWYC